MIEYLRGVVAELTPTQVTLECHGVGYALAISLNTYAAIQGKAEMKLYVHEVIREDAYTLFGFANKQERSLFLLLTSVTGIGGNTARMILSAYSPPELCNIITSENDKMLKSVKGIGLKTAQRVIVDLKDKIALEMPEAVATGSATSSPTVNKEIMQEAVSALTMLGFAPAASQKVVQQLLTEAPQIPVEQVIKQALKLL